MTRRLIARLDIKGPDLVKGVHLEGLRVLGSPGAFARHYYEGGIDELIYQDVVASLHGRNALEEFVRATARDVFVPLTVGGGLRTLEDVRAMLRAGADKVALNTAAVARPELVREVSRVFGASSVVVAIEAIRQPDGRYLASTDSGREVTSREVVEWARTVESLGAGEILLTSVDREGTGRGFDLDLTARVGRAVSIPVVAHGGAGEPCHLAQALTTGRSDAVAVASLLHYGAVREMGSRGGAAGSGNREFLRGGASHARFRGHTVAALKRHLERASIEVRPVPSS
jgi:imidazole glycerol-phosphate synthase subunit HisF